MYSKEEVMENLVLADQFFSVKFPEVKNLKLVITGGASFLLKGFRNKCTLDIDTITKLDDDVLDYLESFCINDSASEVSKIASSYEPRMEKLSGDFQVLDVYQLSDEDLVLSKIGRLSEDDLLDLRTSGILDVVNGKRLAELAEEISAIDEDFKKKWIYFQNLYM